VARFSVVMDCPPRAGADDDNGVELFVLAREQDVGAQHAVGLGVLAFGAFVQQVADVLRDDAEHRRLECTFHLFNCFDAGIQILNEESQTNAHNQTDDDAENDVQGLFGLTGNSPGWAGSVISTIELLGISTSSFSDSILAASSL